jgi:hypothetical protein
MDDYEDIEAAARHWDWQGCARIMFGLLYERTPDEQREIAAKALATYIKIWKSKHQGVWREVPEELLIARSIEKRITLPDFPEELDLDPADAEFENGLTEFWSGAYSSSNHANRTRHFATSIQSAVTARQIHKWIQHHPTDFVKWKAGRLIDEPTFLDDQVAIAEAQKAWEYVDRLFKSQRRHPPLPAVHRKRSSKRAMELYRRWESSIL